MMNNQNLQNKENANFIKSDTQKNTVPLWKKIVFYIGVSCMLIISLVGVFWLIIKILLSQRAFFAPQTVPWLYISVYLVSGGIVLFIFFYIYYQIKDNRKWNKYFFHFINKEK